jgi:type IV secretion system protein TrbL
MVIVIKCEAMITMTAALIMVGFGASGLFRDFAVNTIRYAFAVAFKLFVMQLVLGVGISFIKEFETTTAQFQDIFVLIGAAVILYLLVKSLPDVCAGIISGSHVSSASASSVGGAMKAAGGTVLGAGLGAYAAGSSLRSASKLADMAGKTGLGKAGHMGKALFDAGRQVHREKTQMKGGALAKTNHIMQERLENARLSKDEEA